MANENIEVLEILPRQGPNGSPRSTGDNREKFVDSTERFPVDPKLRDAFVTNRRRILASHPMLSAAQRSRVLRDMDVRLGPARMDDAAMPVPGGVGYGMFYSGPFKSAFQTGTGIYWEIVCPTQPGGNVNTTLYLTATNRAGMGVEALAAYDGQRNPSFYVYDWARESTSRWQVNMPFGEIGEYLKQDAAHGVAFQVLPVMNMTFTNAPGTWVNQVWLINHTTNKWDLVYQYSYAASADQMFGQWPGSWGPILETFQDAYSGTNDLGALNTQLSNQNNGQWSSWSPLGADEAQLRVDNKGFLPEFLDPNSSWVVHS